MLGLPQELLMRPPRRHHRRHARARDRGAVLHPPAGRPRRPRDQDRASRQRRLRARLRRARARPGLAFRLDQPFEGKPDARREAPRGARDPRSAARARPTCWCRTSRPARRHGWASTTRPCAPRIRGLIVCDISGYGDATARYRDKKAYDLLIQSESGFLSVTGTPDEPAKAGCSIADISAGMYAYSNILAALLERGAPAQGRASTSRCSRRWPSG